MRGTEDKERKGKERKGKERKGKERKGNQEELFLSSLLSSKILFIIVIYSRITKFSYFSTPQIHAGWRSMT